MILGDGPHTNNEHMSFLWESWDDDNTDSIKCSTTSSQINDEEYNVSSQFPLCHDYDKPSDNAG